MAERAFFGEMPHIYAEGNSVSFVAKTNGEIRESLKNRLENHIYLNIDSDDELPRPLKALRLASFWDDDSLDDDETNATLSADLVIDSSIALPANVFRREGATGVFELIDIIQGDLTREHNARVIELPHDPLTFHLIDGSGEAFSISYDASLSDALFHITTEEASEISDFLDDKPSIEHATPETRLRSVVAMMTTIIDRLNELYDKSGDQRRYRFELTGPQTLPPEILGGAVVRLATQIDMAAAATSPEFTLEHSSKQAFDTLGGLFATKQRLKEIGDIFMDDPAATQSGLKLRPILLYGPPGTGKTRLLEALASYTGAQKVPLESAKILDGRSVATIAHHFNDAYRLSAHQRVIVTIDDIDKLAGWWLWQRSPTIYLDIQKELQRQITTELPQHPGALLAVTTHAAFDNLPDTFSHPGRFEKFYITVPAHRERVDIWFTVLAARINDLEKIAQDPHADSSTDSFYDLAQLDYEKLATLTDGMTGADITVAADQALYRCIKRYREYQTPQLLSQETLEQAIADLRRRL